MMKMTEEKKFRYEWLYRSIVITLLTAFLLGGIKYVPKMVRAVETLTFDSIEQKEQMKQLLNRVETLTPVQLENLRFLVNDENRHMSKQEKESLIIMGQGHKQLIKDIDEVKELLKVLVKK